MTTHKKKTPVTAPTVNEGNELETGSTTAYLAYFSENTRDTYGTWSGESLPMKGHITILIPFRTAQRMYAEGPQLIDLNRACAEAQSAEVRKVRQEREEEERRRLRNRIAAQIEEEEFEDQLADLDEKATEIYRLIDKKVDAVIEGLGKKS